MSRPTSHRRRNETHGPSGTVPRYALAASGLFVVVIAVMVLTGHDHARGTSFIIATAASTLPSLLASAFAERVSRDVRNGVMVEKARAGAHEAIHEAGPEVIANALNDHRILTRDGGEVTVAMQALTELLRTIQQTPGSPTADPTNRKDTP